MSRSMSEMNCKERDKLEKILDRSIDFENETFSGGGAWEGGHEDIPFADLLKGIQYIQSIGVKINQSTNEHIK